MNKALLIDHSTGDISSVTIDGTDGIRNRLDGYVRGTNIAELGENIFLRKWSSCVDPAFRQPSGIEIVDAYSSITLKPIDVPITAEEYQTSFGAPERMEGIRL